MDFLQARTKVGVGWYTPLYALYGAMPAGCEIAEISRVEGRLHVTVQGATPGFMEAIKAAEEESARTCEDCGNNGGHRRELDGSEILTLCDACQLLRAHWRRP